MPLTQARYMTLLAACDAYEAKLLQLQRLVRDSDSAITAGTQSIDQAYRLIGNVIVEDAIPTHIATAVAAERAHFLATSHRNNHVREYRRRLRAGKSTLGAIGERQELQTYVQPRTLPPLNDAPPATPRHPQLTEEFLASVREGIAADLAGERYTLPSMRKCQRWCGHKSGYSCLMPDSLHYRCTKDPQGELRPVEPAEPEAVDTESDF